MNLDEHAEIKNFIEALGNAAKLTTQNPSPLGDVRKASSVEWFILRMRLYELFTPDVIGVACAIGSQIFYLLIKYLLEELEISNFAHAAAMAALLSVTFTGSTRISIYKYSLREKAREGAAILQSKKNNPWGDVANDARGATQRALNTISILNSIHVTLWATTVLVAIFVSALVRLGVLAIMGEPGT